MHKTDKLEKHRKKAQEEYIITKFISNDSLRMSAYGLDASETPDFKVKTMQGIFSVELTSIVTPEIKAVEVMQKRIVDGAKELFAAKHKEKLTVLVMFDNTPISCKKSEEPVYSKELFDIVERVYLANRDFEFKTKYKGRIRPTPYLDDIIISNDTNIDNWQPFGAFVVPRPDFSIVDKVIKGKEKGLLKYQQEFKENWLVIAANFGHRSSANDFVFFDGYKANTKFDRVFVYSLREDEFLSLK